jgi:glycosyltransferase involved in cell wall biosynthesis
MTARASEVDIVVPVLNEEACIDEFYERVALLGLADSLIFVDNASVDGTVERIRRHCRARLICHERNEGYGASVRHGIESGAGQAVVIIDADLEYPPESIPALLDALREHEVVYCSRFLGPHPPDMPLFRRLGNRLMSGIYNALYGQRVTDLYTGMKGFRRDAFPVTALVKDGFEHGAEIAALISFSGRRIHEIPVDYVPRQKGASKMRHVPEALKLAFYVLAYRLRGSRGDGNGRLRSRRSRLP